jgi:hydrogenase maturation protein HypF
MMRLAVEVRGIVQGVGFRPFVHAAATRRGLSGWVRNRADGVSLEVEGRAAAVRAFLAALRADAPSIARVEDIEIVELSPCDDPGPFRILPSASRTPVVRATLPADLAVCADCLAEMTSPADRRHGHAFITCTACGPRYTIVESLPYDRARTVMREFPLCPACRSEYDDPGDRRFHAEPLACPDCGPRLRLLGPGGAELAAGDDALERAAASVASGAILALKGLGGFQLLVDATDASAVARLRARKRRDAKPFAVLFPDLAAMRAACVVSDEEAAWLAGGEAPILLLERRHGAGDGLAESVAPGVPRLGGMLPTSPLHHLLARALERPLVCTSGNRSEEPICIDQDEAVARLGDVADVILSHDRRIVRPVDDSVARVGPGGLEVLRRARGFAPLPLPLSGAPAGIVALGAQLKSAVAITLPDAVLPSQHLGDLHAVESVALLERTVDDLLRLFDVRPLRVASDLHPDYASTRLAERLAATWGVPLVRVQHHHAHVAACVAEHGLSGPLLGLAWDGAGLGTDGTLWGGEALLVDGPRWRRAAHLLPFQLPGGERAMREPRRAALALLHATARADAVRWAARAFRAGETEVLLAMLDAGRIPPRTTSVGRLFDGIAALAGLCLRVSFEGQAALAVETAAGTLEATDAYPIPLDDGEPAVADWRPLVRAVWRDAEHGESPAVIAARFHAALVDLAEACALRSGAARVVLTGGCFQNLRLARDVRARLEARGLSVFTPRLLPPNDGGVAVGQAAIAAALGAGVG